MKRIALGTSIAAALLIGGGLPDLGSREAKSPDGPRVLDPRLVITRFAGAPDVVHPIALDVDAKGRVLVVESHTHFAPPGYQGPKHDRVRLLADTDGDGTADKVTTFFEGTRHTMDLAVAADGAVYLATRNEILRLRDTDGDGTADAKERVVFLDTKGDYPHNGLSGLCFDTKGDLTFGMGENLGAAYKLVGKDGRTFAGEADGGHVFTCAADGSNLRRVATGFWNPFGIARDVFGRTFAVDNDPDAAPPCRLVHVVPGGDFGFQFRYGRAGRHVFQSWHGTLPGTLPMMSGTGEAPCEVLSYESDALPAEYRGDLLVTAWADHRVERYAARPHGASARAERRPFVQGGKNFRPVGLATAPDGSLFVSDWVRSDYTLHGQGGLWHIKPREPHKAARPADPRAGLRSAHRPLREAAARTLAKDETGRAFLRKQLAADDVRVRAASLTALVDAGDRDADLAAVAAKDAEPALRALAVRALAARGDDVRPFLDAKQPAGVRFEAVAGLTTAADLPRLLALLADADPFVQTAAVQQFARHPDLLAPADAAKEPDPRRRVGLLLAHRAAGRPSAGAFLADADEDVRFLAAKWVADEKLAEHRPAIEHAMKDAGLNVRMYAAYATALARLDGRPGDEGGLAAAFLGIVTAPRRPAGQRVLALRQIPATHPKLTVAVLGQLLAADDAAVQREAVRALCDHPDAKRGDVLLQLVRDPRRDAGLKAQALVGLADRAPSDELLTLAGDDAPAVRDEALRALAGAKLTAAQRQVLEDVARRRPATADLVARALGRPFFTKRPAAADLAGWRARLDGPADADAGRRVFAHPQLAGCVRCHRAEGRGRDVGPDLGTVGRTERRHLLESILQPSATVAPHFQAWQVETADGKVRTGLLVRTHLDESTYLDSQGGLFTVNSRDGAEGRPLPTSLMPDGLADRLTDQELRDLLAYLASLK